jgi:hypothetical protein
MKKTQVLLIKQSNSNNNIVYLRMFGYCSFFLFSQKDKQVHPIMELWREKMDVFGNNEF